MPVGQRAGQGDCPFDLPCAPLPSKLDLGWGTWQQSPALFCEPLILNGFSQIDLVLAIGHGPNDAQNKIRPENPLMS